MVLFHEGRAWADRLDALHRFGADCDVSEPTVEMTDTDARTLAALVRKLSDQLEALGNQS